MQKFNPELIDREVAFYKRNYNGVTDNDNIRKELRTKNVEEHNIRAIINELERDYVPPTPKLYSLFLMLAGGAMIFMAIYVYKFVWDYGYIVVSMGLILLVVGGISMLYSGFKGFSRK